jgi:hypothetical protein
MTITGARCRVLALAQTAVSAYCVFQLRRKRYCRWASVKTLSEWELQAGSK